MAGTLRGHEGDVDVLNALIVSETPGSGRFIATLVNNVTDEADTLESVQGVGESAEVTFTIEGGDTEIPPGGSLSLAADESAMVAASGSEELLAPGLFVRVRVPLTEPQPRLLVNERAIAADQRGQYVLVVNDKQVVERRPVELGIQHEGKRVIKTGLSGEEWLVVNGLQRARPGTTVKPIKSTEVAATFSTAGSLLLLLAAIVWLKSPFLGMTAVLIYLGAQEDLGTTRYFASLREPPQKRGHASGSSTRTGRTPSKVTGVAFTSGNTSGAPVMAATSCAIPAIDRQSARLGVILSVTSVSSRSSASRSGMPGFSDASSGRRPLASSSMPSSFAEHSMPCDSTPRMAARLMTRPPGSVAPSSATGRACGGCSPRSASCSRPRRAPGPRR